MIKKNIIFISIIFFLANCGFPPIYLQNTNVNFSIEQVDYTGDRELNNFLKTKLNQFKKKNNDNKIYIAKKSQVKPIWHPLCAMIAPTGNGKLKVINSHNQELINDMCDDLSYEDFDIAAPVKARFDPERL